MKNGSKENKVKINTWLLAFYFLIAPLDFIPLLPGISMSKVIIFIPIIGVIAHLRNFRLRVDRYSVILIVYLMLIVISGLYSFDTTNTIQRIITISLNVSVVLVLSMLSYNEREIGILIKSVVLSGWFTLILLLVYSDTNIMGGRLTVFINGSYQDPNYITGFLIFSIIYYFDKYINKKSKISLVNLIIFLLFTIFTGSRGGLIAIIGAIICYLILQIKGKRLKLSVVLKTILSISVIAILFKSIFGLLPQEITQRYDVAFTINDGGAGRTNVWVDLIDHYSASSIFNKFFGWGAGTIQHFNYGGAVAHNVWIETLIELGILGLFILIYMYFIFIKRSIYLKQYVLVSALIGYLIMTFSMSLYSYKPIWNILILILITKNNSVFLSKRHDNSEIEK